MIKEAFILNELISQGFFNSLEKLKQILIHYLKILKYLLTLYYCNIYGFVTIFLCVVFSVSVRWKKLLQ